MSEVDILIRDKVKSQDDLFRFIQNRIDKISNYNLLLGAGASCTSGILTAENLIQEWKEDIFNRYNKENIPFNNQNAQDLFAKEFGREYDKNREYSFLFQQKYHRPNQRRNFIEQQIKDSVPSIGYKYLSNLIRGHYFNTIFTTNFDDLIEQCLLTANLDIKPIVCSHDASISSISVVSNRPKIIKLHGDFLYDDIKATLSETNRLEMNMQNKFEEFLRNFGLIVIGYSGRDDSIMDILERFIRQEGYLDSGLYWCVRNIDEIENNPRLKKLLLNEKAYIIEIEGFDQFFAALNDAIEDKNYDKDPFRTETKYTPPLPYIENSISQFSSNPIIIRDCKLAKAKFPKLFTNILAKLSSNDDIKNDFENDLVKLVKQTETNEEIIQKISELNGYLKEEQTDKALSIISDLESQVYNFSDIQLYNLIVNIKVSLLKNEKRSDDVLNCLLKLKQTNEGKKYFSDKLYIEMIEVYIDKEEFEKAIEVIQEAIAYNAYNDKFYLLLAKCQETMFHYDKSNFSKDMIVENFKKSIQINPSVKANNAYRDFADFLLSSKSNYNEEKMNQILETFKQQNPYDLDYPYILSQMAIKADLFGFNNAFENLKKLYDSRNSCHISNYKGALYKFFLKACQETKRISEFEKCKEEVPFVYRKTTWFIKTHAKFELICNKNLNNAISILERNLDYDRNFKLLKLLLTYKIYKEDFDFLAKYIDTLPTIERFDIMCDWYVFADKKEDLYNLITNYYSKKDSKTISDFMSYSYYLLVCKKYDECIDLLRENNGKASILTINYELARKLSNRKVRKEKLLPIYNNGEAMEKAAAAVLLDKEGDAISVLNKLIEDDYSQRYKIRKFPVFQSIKNRISSC
ncbi:MAG: SIR2 family protein [Alphaproteobacteria bacterium]|nr:SIR2 family protein [Alphaproteobacteria bacterium]